ncbi:hypothetical protein DPSP01_005270 [Paraphaeosphaeria sporulosa]|uniref:Cupredoxin n=1 Tax=Paraphaeosphaeria sporulosa TaxID=1460663 RepID=A0A177C3P0_9PLEO|nr:uncharacterized protein CC84DRAFT_1009963 [Paraphaeosphaeria sporulosa]OAG02354.1 hypothetical protein CC84DRAFT_1009963 [Paraphaeosphaeria sporulosa]
MQLILSSLLLAVAVSALPAEPMLGTSGLRANIRARQAKVIPVVVGGPQDTFNPNSVTAAVGDIIQFQFSNGNHTATQSSLEAPCTPLNGGINSGHIPFKDGQTTVGTFSMVVSSTDPIFMFCSTGPHCQEGQVMIINPTGAQQILDFVKAAQGTDKSVEGTAIAGGTTSQIELTNAAFVPAPAGAGGPPGGAPPAAAPPAANATAPAQRNAPEAKNGTAKEGEKKEKRQPVLLAF